MPDRAILTALLYHGMGREELRPWCRCRRPVFRPVTSNRTKELERALNPNSIYRNIAKLPPALRELEPAEPWPVIYSRELRELIARTERNLKP